VRRAGRVRPACFAQVRRPLRRRGRVAQPLSRACMCSRRLPVPPRAPAPDAQPAPARRSFRLAAGGAGGLQDFRAAL
jgi:hypothetical protein